MRVWWRCCDIVEIFYTYKTLWCTNILYITPSCIQYLYIQCVSVFVCGCVLYHNMRQPVRGTSFQVAIKRVFTFYCLRCRWQRVVGIIYATNLVDRINSTPQVNPKLSSGLLYSIVGQAARWNDHFPSNLETFYYYIHTRIHYTHCQR